MSQRQQIVVPLPSIPPLPFSPPPQGLSLPHPQPTWPSSLCPSRLRFSRQQAGLAWKPVHDSFLFLHYTLYSLIRRLDHSTPTAIKRIFDIQSSGWPRIVFATTSAAFSGATNFDNLIVSRGKGLRLGPWHPSLSLSSSVHRFWPAPDSPCFRSGSRTVHPPPSTPTTHPHAHANTLYSIYPCTHASPRVHTPLLCTHPVLGTWLSQIQMPSAPLDAGRSSLRALGSAVNMAVTQSAKAKTKAGNGNGDAKTKSQMHRRSRTGPLLPAPTYTLDLADLAR